LCAKQAHWVRLANIVEWKDERPGDIIGTKNEYLCDEHAERMSKRGNRVIKLHVLAVG
jgi:hypothetical protein